MGIEVHVKDAARFEGGWAFFQFDGKKTGKLVIVTPATLTTRQWILRLCSSIQHCCLWQKLKERSRRAICLRGLSYGRSPFG